MNPQSVRRWHLYLGLLTAPSILFFSLTGAVQLFRLHEAHDSYRPAALVEKLAQLHKDQAFELGHHQAGPPPAAAAGSSQAKPDQDEDGGSWSVTLLRSYFLVVALALAISSVLGIWIAFTQTRSRTAAWRLLIAGLLIPIALMFA